MAPTATVCKISVNRVGVVHQIIIFIIFKIVLKCSFTLFINCSFLKTKLYCISSARRRDDRRRESEIGHTGHSAPPS